MKLRIISCATAIAMLTAVAIPVALAAQNGTDHHDQQHRYKLVDVGTFGGPDSYFIFGVGLNNRGEAPLQSPTGRHQRKAPKSGSSLAGQR